MLRTQYKLMDMLMVVSLVLVFACKPRKSGEQAFSKILATVSNKKSIYVELAKNSSNDQLKLNDHKLLNVYLLEQGKAPIVVRGVSGYIQEKFVSSRVSEAKKGWPIPEAKYHLDPVYEDSLNPEAKGEHFYYLTFDESMELHEEAPRFGMGIILDADFGDFEQKDLDKARDLAALKSSLRKRVENSLVGDSQDQNKKEDEDVKKVAVVEKDIESTEDFGFASLSLAGGEKASPGTAGELAIVSPKEFDLFEEFVSGSSHLIEVVVDYELGTVDAPELLVEWIYAEQASNSALDEKADSKPNSSGQLHCDAKKLDRASTYGAGLGGLEQHCGEGKPDRCDPKVVECLKSRSGKLPGQPPFCSVLDFCDTK